MPGTDKCYEEWARDERVAQCLHLSSQLASLVLQPGHSLSCQEAECFLSWCRSYDQGHKSFRFCEQTLNCRCLQSFALCVTDTYRPILDNSGRFVFCLQCFLFHPPSFSFHSVYALCQLSNPQCSVPVHPLCFPHCDTAADQHCHNQNPGSFLCSMSASVCGHWLRLSQQLYVQQLLKNV